MASVCTPRHVGVKPNKDDSHNHVDGDDDNQAEADSWMTSNRHLTP